MAAIESLMQLLDGYQRRIADKLDMKMATVTASSDARAQTLARARWELARVLREYQLFKHSGIFDPAIRSDVTSYAQWASELKTRCIAAGEAYKEHVRKWSVSGGDADWPSYERDLRQTIHGIRRHLATERRHIRILLTRRKPADDVPRAHYRG